MNIEYVVSTMVFWGRENRISLVQECDLLRSMGFGVELWPSIKGYNECRYSRRNWTRLAETTENMLVTIRSRNDSPTLEQWTEQIDCARFLDVTNIVTSLEDIGIPNGPDDNNCDLAVEVVRQAEKNNIRLCLETGNLPALKRTARRFDSIWYCLDTGYANLDPGITFNQYVDELSSRVACLHLADNYGRIDDHEPPGIRGGISKENWDYLLNSLSRYDNYIVASLEMSPWTPDIMIRHASTFLFDVMKWPNRPSRLPESISVNYKQGTVA
jgi:sugar phosphate isomerase/epimerase